MGGERKRTGNGILNFSHEDGTPAMPMSFDSESADGMFTTPVVGPAATPFGPGAANANDPLANAGGNTQGGILPQEDSLPSSLSDEENIDEEEKDETEEDKSDNDELYNQLHRQKTHKGTELVQQ